MFISSLEDTISPENLVRLIDSLSALSLQTVGFLFKPLKM
jgi:hypothetical protein